MIAVWILYCALCALGLAVAAVLAERALLAANAPVRYVWMGAIALSLIIPAAAYRLATRPTDGPSLAIEHVIAIDSVADQETIVASPVVPQPETQPVAWNRSRMLATLSRANGPLTVAWLASSIALASYFLVGLVILARIKRRWYRQDVLGVSVLVSERTGPAIVGTLAPTIVMPEWALAMPPQQLTLMLQHEQEHRRAGDAQLLTAAHIALIAMPWNAALWWAVVRLEMAVELDCDARVLRNADARAYGNLLLEVARPHHRFTLIGATAFAERAGQLERRIRALGRRRARSARSARGARATAVFIALVAMTVACAAPRPPVPPRSASSHPEITAGPTAPIVTPAVERLGRAPAAEAPHAATVANAPPPTRTRSRLDSTLNTPGLPPLAFPVPQRAVSPLADSALVRLFAGIVLNPAQEAAARQLLNMLADRQVAQTTTATLAVIRAAPARLAVQTRRDSALRALLPTDADRAMYDSQIAAGAGGGRSGSGIPPQLFPRGRVGRGGGGDTTNMQGGARGGGRARSGSSTPNISMADATFERLLGGFALTPDQQANARAVIIIAQQELLQLMPEPPLMELQLVGPSLVVMRSESKEVLSALLTNDADRSTLESRIATETRVVLRAPALPRPRL